MTTPKRAKTKVPYQLRYKFSGRIEDIEQWLTANCSGAFEYEFEGYEKTEGVFSQLIVLFSFQHAADREKFKSAIKAGHI